MTQNGNKLYYHITEPVIGLIPLMGLEEKRVKHIRLLSTGCEVKIVKDWISNNYPDVVMVSLGPDPKLPDPIDTVLEVTLKDE